MNNAKSRLQALGFLDRSFKNASDDELNGAIEALDEEHRAALDELVKGEANADLVREAIGAGRLDGTMESAALVITDACLADCIEQLGDHADHPSYDQLQEVLPGLVETHSTGIVQIMLASTVTGEAPASAIIRDILKHDDALKLPPVEPTAGAPLLDAHGDQDADERAALKAKRKEAKRKQQEEARARREQAQRAKRR